MHSVMITYDNYDDHWTIQETNHEQKKKALLRNIFFGRT